MISAVRLTGALRRIRNKIAEDVVKAVRAAGYTVNETDPFKDEITIIFSPRERSPYFNRIRTYWQCMRMTLYLPLGLPTDKDAYLKQVDNSYTSDAYHSLSIDGLPIAQISRNLNINCRRLRKPNVAH